MDIIFSSRSSSRPIPEYDSEFFPIPREGENFYVHGESWPAKVVKVTYDFSERKVYVELN